MSVAVEFAPVEFSAGVAAPARGGAHIDVPSRLATVTVLRPPAHVGGAAPLRLTRRGVVVLALAVALLGLGLVWLARASAPRPAGPAASAPHAVTVQAGDTLWSIASRVAPDRDPRAEVAELQQRNHLTSVALTPGQVLRVH
jgi:Tfp pilus assembly protein FimV